ncbi:MAG: TonB family protein [Spirochaetales bacterium]|nr:TonB family protein [Spirochaetales bacterium]
METIMKQPLPPRVGTGNRSVPPWSRTLVYGAAAAVHVILLLTLTFKTVPAEDRIDHSIFKVVDITELAPVKEQEDKPVEKTPPKREEVIEVDPQEGVVEDVKVTDKTVMEADAPIEYLPQHKISRPPGIPTDRIRENIIYPALANKQKIEGVVYLMLYIDSTGRIRDIEVLKDPGYGLAQAAVAAFEGITCTPAMANETPVAVRFRYPIRFSLE